MIRPTPSAKPPIETILSVSPVKYISVKVEMTEIGIETPMTITGRTLRINNMRMSNETAPPMSKFSVIERIELRINIRRIQDDGKGDPFRHNSR